MKVRITKRGDGRGFEAFLWDETKMVPDPKFTAEANFSPVPIIGKERNEPDNPDVSGGPIYQDEAEYIDEIKAKAIKAYTEKFGSPPDTVSVEEPFAVV